MTQVIQDLMVIEVLTVEEDSAGTHIHKTLISDAVEYAWYYDFFLIYTNIAQSYFDRWDIYSITVDGVEIDIPLT